ncbi:MAG: hypothetical protein DRP95_00380 [Candidatus Latescibacterota bacterium]|nr:MAG: hypothetical protein DRP95_00380 [Candidatus Latescibacterota bacterium]
MGNKGSYDYWRDVLKYLGLISQLGLVMASAIVVGLLLGLFLDEIIGGKGTFVVLGILSGIGAGFFYTYKLLRSSRIV